MFPIQAQKKIASYKENNQEQKTDDSLSDMIICDHPLSKNTKNKKKKTKMRVNKGFWGFESTSSEDESNKGSPKHDPILNNKEKICKIKRPSKEPKKPNLTVDKKPNRDEKVVETEKRVNCRE